MPRRGHDVSLIVEQVKARLKQIEDQVSHHQRLADELERVRDVVKELERAVVSRVGGARHRAAEPAAPAVRAEPVPAPTPAPTPAATPARTPRGQNKARILAALEGRGPMTAAEVAKLTGISASTVSTTLTKMGKTGELVKAERGYKLPEGKRATAAP